MTAGSSDVRLNADELDLLERAGRARAWDEGETHALGRAVVELTDEIRASWNDTERLRTALADLLPHVTEHNGNWAGKECAGCTAVIAARAVLAASVPSPPAATKPTKES